MSVEYEIAGHYDFALYGHLINRPYVRDIVGITRRPLIVDGIVERDNGGIGLSLGTRISAYGIMLAVENSKRLQLTVVYKVLAFVHVGSGNFDFGYRNRKVNALAARSVGISKRNFGCIYSKFAYACAAALGNDLSYSVGIICRDNHTFGVKSFEYRISRLVRKRSNLYSLEYNAYYVVDVNGSGKAVVAYGNTARTRRERTAKGILLLRKNACYTSVVVDCFDYEELFEVVQISGSIYRVFACRVLSRNGSNLYLLNIDCNSTFSGSIVGGIVRRERPVVGRGAVDEYTFYPRDSTGSISFARRDSGHSVTVEVVAVSAAAFNNGSYVRLSLVDSPRETQRLALTRIPLIVFGIVERYGCVVRACRRSLVARDGVSGIGSYNVSELAAVVRKDLRLGYRCGNLLFDKLVSERSGRSGIVAASVVKAHSNGISTCVENLGILAAYADSNRQRIALDVIGDNEVFGDFAARNYVSVVHTRSRALSSLYGNLKSVDGKFYACAVGYVVILTCGKSSRNGIGTRIDYFPDSLAVLGNSVIVYQRRALTFSRNGRRYIEQRRKIGKRLTVKGLALRLFCSNMYFESFDSERCVIASGNFVVCIIVGGSRNLYRIYSLIFRRALRKYGDTYSVFGHKSVASYCHLVIGEVIGFCIVSLCCILYGERNRPCRNGKGFVLALRNCIVGVSVRGSRDNKRIYALIRFFVCRADARRNCVGSYEAVHTVYGVTVEIVQLAVINLGRIVYGKIYALGIDCQSLVCVFGNGIVGIAVQRRGDYERITSCVCRSRRRRHAYRKVVHKTFGTRYAYRREVVYLAVVFLNNIVYGKIYLSLGNLHSSRLSSRRTAVYEELVVFGRKICRYGDFARVYVTSRVIESNLLALCVKLRAFGKHVGRNFRRAVILHIGRHLNSTRNLCFADGEVYACAVGSIIGFALADVSRNRINSCIDYSLGRNAEVVCYIVCERALRHIEQTCVIRKLSIVVSLALLCFRAYAYRHRRDSILRTDHAVR